MTAPGALSPEKQSGRWAILVAVAFLALHLPSLRERFEPNTWLARDGSFYFTTLLAVAEHGRFEQRALQPESWYTQKLGWNDRLPEDWSNVSLGRNGGWYPKHPILLPILAVPLYWMFGPIGSLITNVLLNLAFVLLVFLLARRAVRAWVAAAIAVGFAALPFVRMMSYSFSNDLLSADLALGALEATLGGWFGTAGVLAGFCIWSRLTNAAFLPGLCLIAWDVGGRRALSRAILASLLPLGLFAAFNTWAFGAPWITSYQSVIVREAGRQTVATHTDLFNVPWRRGLNRVVFEDDGIFKTFPPFAFGLAGLFVLAVRRGFRLASGLALFCLLPAAAVMTYEWYRPHFVLGGFGASAIGLAAAIALIFPQRSPAPAGSELTRRRLSAVQIVAACVGVLAICVVTRRILRPDPRLLSSHIHEGRVFLDNVPCDYWNPQRERWECSHFDPEMWAMTGAILGPPLTVNHEPRRGIWMHPSPTGKWRRLVFPELGASAADLQFALADESRNGPVQIEVLPRGRQPIELTVSKPGEELRQHIDIGRGDGPALEIRVRSSTPMWKHLVLEGKLG